VLTLAGVYRLPEHARAGLDPGIVRCFAAVGIDSFIARLAWALMHPAGSAVPAGRAGQNSRATTRRGDPTTGRVCAVRLPSLGISRVWLWPDARRQAGVPSTARLAGCGA
jgi:hypothetical protein